MHTISYTYISIYTCIHIHNPKMHVGHSKEANRKHNGHPITTSGHNIYAYWYRSHMLGFQVFVPTVPRPMDQNPTWWHQQVIILFLSSNHETSPSTWCTNTNVVKNENQRLQDYKYNLYANVYIFRETTWCRFWKPYIYIHQKSTEDMLRALDDLSNPFPDRR